jgi:hypothetical protein
VAEDQERRPQGFNVFMKYQPEDDRGRFSGGRTSSVRQQGSARTIPRTSGALEFGRGDEKL